MDRFFFPKTGVSGVRSIALPRRDALMALSSTSTLCNTLLMQDEGHHWSTPSPPWTTLSWPMWSWWETPGFVKTTFCHKPGDSPGRCRTEASCLSCSSSATWCWLPSEKPARSSFSKVTPIPQLPSNIDLPLVTRKLRRANRNHLSSSFKIQQIPHQGGEFVSVWLVLLFICLRTTPAASREEFHSHVGVWCQVPLICSKSPTFPGSLHPEMLAKNLFYTPQQTARSCISQRNNLTMGNKFTFSLKMLLWV